MKALLVVLTFFSHLNAQEQAYDNMKPLTFEEEQQSKEYVHQGQVQQVMNETCNKDVDEDGFADDDLCTNSQTAWRQGKIGNVLAQMLPQVQRVYSLAFSDNSELTKRKRTFSLKNNPNNKESISKQKFNNINDPEQKKAYKEDTRGVTDYCRHIPTATDLGAQGYQMIQQQQMQQQFEQTDSSYRQKAALETVRDNQRSMQKATAIQVGGWGATTACYATYLIGGISSMKDPKIWLKLSGSALIGSFYELKRKEHKNRVERINKVISDLPQKGACNPMTETTCFCGEDSSRQVDPNNFAKYCTPLAFKDRMNKSPSVCIDRFGKSDPSCKCKKDGGCLDYRLKAQAAKIGLNPALMNQPLEVLKPLTQGTGLADMDNLIARNRAFNDQAMKKLADKVPKLVGPLTDSEKKLARDLVNAGIPPKIAATAARATRGGSSAPSSSLPTSLTAAALENSLNTDPKNLPAVMESRITRGGRSKARSRSRSRDDDDEFVFEFGKKKKAKEINAIEIEDGYEDLAQRAISSADINKDTSKGLFHILSHRYKMSAWKKLETPLESK